MTAAARLNDGRAVIPRNGYLSVPSADAVGVDVGLMERGLALAGLVLTAPAMAVAALAIRRSSPGPVLYRAQRAGQAGRPFTMLKLRTMHMGSERLGQITGGMDGRVFPAGRVLRRLKFDEVPQLVNIVRGEMAFIGPRPEALAIVETDYRPWMLETLRVPPGLVGPGSLWYFHHERELPPDAEAAESLYVRALLPSKLVRELMFVRRPSPAYRWEVVARTLLEIVGLGRLMNSYREKEDREAERLLAQVQSGAPEELRQPASTLTEG